MLCAGCAAPLAPAPTQTPDAQASEQPAAPTPAPTPTQAPAPFVTITEPIRIEAGETKSADLNGDGEEEKVSILVVENDPGAEADETVYYFVVTDGAGKETLRHCSELYTYACYAYVADMDADGRAELFFSQTYMSDDLITKCWRQEGETFRGLCFLERDCETCVSDCYGLVEGFCDNGIRVSAYVNLLGTRVGQRDYLLSGDVFVPAPDSVWDFRQTLPPDDADTWTYYALKTAKPLPVVIDGKQETLPARTKLVLTGTDAKESASFITEEGVEGIIQLTPDDVNGWGWAIAGEPEQDWFAQTLPYAG